MAAASPQLVMVSALSGAEAGEKTAGSDDSCSSVTRSLAEFGHESQDMSSEEDDVDTFSHGTVPFARGVSSLSCRSTRSDDLAPGFRFSRINTPFGLDAIPGTREHSPLRGAGLPESVVASSLGVDNLLELLTSGARREEASGGGDAAPKPPGPQVNLTASPLLVRTQVGMMPCAGWVPMTMPPMAMPPPYLTQPMPSMPSMPVLSSPAPPYPFWQQVVANSNTSATQSPVGSAVVGSEVSRIPSPPAAGGSGGNDAATAAEAALPPPSPHSVPRDSGGNLNVSISIGSVGHPDHCAAPCKYSSRAGCKDARGCKDGKDCVRCHLCVWTREAERRRMKATAAAPLAVVPTGARPAPVGGATPSAR